MPYFHVILIYVCILQNIESLKSASLRLMTEDRLPLPRYFFQRLQTTTATVNALTMSIHYINSCKGCNLITNISLMLATPTKILKFESPISQKLVREFKRTVSSMFYSTRTSICSKNFVFIGCMLSELQKAGFI